MLMTAHPRKWKKGGGGEYNDRDLTPPPSLFTILLMTAHPRKGKKGGGGCVLRKGHSLPFSFVAPLFRKFIVIFFLGKMSFVKFNYQCRFVKDEFSPIGSSILSIAPFISLWSTAHWIFSNIYTSTNNKFLTLAKILFIYQYQIYCPGHFATYQENQTRVYEHLSFSMSILDHNPDYLPTNLSIADMQPFTPSYPFTRSTTLALPLPIYQCQIYNSDC